MGRLSKLRVVDPVLTNLATGYTNEQFVGDQLMPFVLVDKEGGKIPLFGKEHFKVYSTERALRAKSNRINPEDIGEVDVALDEHPVRPGAHRHPTRRHNTDLLDQENTNG